MDENGEICSKLTGGHLFFFIKLTKLAYQRSSCVRPQVCVKFRPDRTYGIRIASKYISKTHIFGYLGAILDGGHLVFCVRLHVSVKFRPDRTYGIQVTNKNFHDPPPAPPLLYLLPSVTK